MAALITHADDTIVCPNLTGGREAAWPRMRYDCIPNRPGSLCKILALPVLEVIHSRTAKVGLLRPSCFPLLSRVGGVPLSSFLEKFRRGNSAAVGLALRQLYVFTGLSSRSARADLSARVFSLWCFCFVRRRATVFAISL